MEIELGEIIVDEELEIGEIELDVIKIEPDAEQIEITPTKEEQVEKGFFNTVIVKGDENLVPENIKKDVKIFGVKGNYTGKDIVITDGRYLFYQGARTDYVNEILTLCRGLTNVYSMFYNCTNLTELDVSGLDTSNVTSMENMFRSCSELIELNLSSLNTDKVTSMSYMFGDCKKLKTVLNLNTSNVTNMAGMFNGCSSIEEMTQLDTSNVTDMSYLFYKCSKLKTVSILNTSKVTNMNYLFSECRLLESISQMDTSNVAKMDRLFYYCSVLQDVPQLDGSKVISINNFTSYAYKIVNFGGLKNIGKAYTQKSKNYGNYTLGLSACSQLTHESLMNVINGLYDLNLTYDVANGGTLYAQNLQLGSTNLAKLTAEEIAIATSKGWNVT